MKKKEDVICVDFQGWPEFRMTLREVLESLGAEVKDGRLGFPEDSEILSSYPRILVDDGMGYGVGESWVVEADPRICKDADGTGVFNMFREVKDPNVKLEDLGL